MNSLKRVCAALLVALMVLSLAGCQNIRDAVTRRIRGGAADKSGAGYNIYYLNQENDALLGLAYQLSSTTENEIVAECLEALAAQPEDSGYNAVLTGVAALDDYKFDKASKTLAVYMGKNYLSMSREKQLLTRAAVVKTMTQFRNIVDYVTMNIGGTWIRNEGGEVLRMGRDDFVTEITNDLDQLADARMILYFVNEKEDLLEGMEASQRYYNYSRDSLAAVVMDALLRGPVKDQYRMPFSVNTQVRSVHISDGLCAVDFNQAFLKPVEDIPFELTVYSVVNSLCELGSVSQVQITVEGETIKDAPEHVDISGPLSPRADLVK